MSGNCRLWRTVGEELNFPTANGVVSNATNVVELPAPSGASTSVQETVMNKKAVVASRHHLWAHAAAITAVCLFTVTNLPAAAQSQTDLERAYRTISSKTFVDLTDSFGPDTPVWSGFGQAKFSPAADPKTHEPYTIPKDGFRTTYYEMVGQYGTHVDPPAHFAESGITMDKIPLKQMIRRWSYSTIRPISPKIPTTRFPSRTSRPGNDSMDVFRKAPSPHCAPTCTKIGTPIAGVSSAAHFRLGPSKQSNFFTNNAA